MINALLARQSIYDKTKSVCAYELLYRSNGAETANIDINDPVAGDNATSFVITQLFTNLDIDTVVGKQLAFINFTRNHLLRQIPALLPKTRVVIEILENVEVDDALIASVVTLSEQGYQFALDDFVFHHDLLPLMEAANIIKVDVLNLNEQQIKAQLAPLSDFKGKLLAEKIEDSEQFLRCQALGFELFQGFFLNKPDLIQGPLLSESKSHLLNLLAELHQPNITLERIEEIILQTPKLSYRILRLANSVSLYTGKKVDSLLDAILQMGLVKIRDWASILLAASIDDTAPDLLERTLIRAKMCEVLSQKIGIGNPHQAYTVGILSSLDAILNQPMVTLLEKIHLNKALNEALLNKQGELGYLLKMALAYEKANFYELDVQRISEKDYTQAYLQGIEYASNTLALLR